MPFRQVHNWQHLLDHHRFPLLRLKCGALDLEDRAVQEKGRSQKRNLPAHQRLPLIVKIHSNGA